MSQSTASAWASLIQESRRAFIDRCGTLPDIDSEAAFRDEFERFSRQRNDWNYVGMLVQLSFASVNAVANAVDDAFAHAPPVKVGVLVSGGCFAAIQRACGAHLPLAEIVGLLGRLNSAVPLLGRDLMRFRDDADAQAPLQDMFENYVASVLFIIDCVNARSALPPLETVQEGANTLRSSELAFAEALERAQRAPRNDGRSSSTSWSNVSNSSDDPQSLRNSQTRFIFGRKLGRGAYGEIDEVRELSTGVVSARKTIYLRGRPDAVALERQVRQEFEIMQRLPHNHIVTVQMFWKEEDSLHILMHPVADSDLRTYLETCALNDYPADSRQKILQWFGCLLDALAFAHRRDIMHRDIKPSNVLVKDGHVYLADFGLAKDFTDLGTSATSTSDVHGTPVYRAPEVKPNHERGRAADVFALGCVFSEMLTVSHGASLDEYQVFRAVPTEEFPWAFRQNLPAILTWLSRLEKLAPDSDLCEDLVGLIKKMLRPAPETRIKAQAALGDLILKDNHRHVFFCRDH